MAITRAQQARQMLKKAGAVEQDGSLNFVNNSESVTVPKEFKARSNAPKVKLAYITDAEAKMLKKKKPGTPHKGPKGIPSYDTFGSIDSSGKDTGVSGETASGFERGDRGERSRADARAAGFSPQDVQDLRSAAIAAGAGQRVNPGFFDSRNLVSPADLAAARAIAPKAFARSRGSGLGAFISGGGILGNLIRGLGQRLGFGRRFNEPSFDMSRFKNLPLGGSAAFQNLDIRDKFDRTADDEDENIDEFGYSPNFLSSLADEVALTREREQRQSDEEDQLGDIDGLMAKLNALETREYNNLLTGKELNMNTPEQNKRLEELEKKKKEEASLINRAIVADGGMIGGGIMDAAGRQQYFLGKLVKKATRAVKKIVKSPIGRLGLFAAASAIPFGASKASLFNRFMALDKGKRMLAGAGLLSAAPLILGQEEEEQGQGLSSTGVGPNINLEAIRRNPFAFQAPGIAGSRFAFAEGSKEPVAKKTMPLLDMGGQEMDLREEGGFVPIGRMEKADDVPARLSKNEFVFTADAVRNAGDGDVDKGAEVMYNMMKNLEAGGDVSEESQGKQGARRMFQTSQRLEEVL